MTVLDPRIDGISTIYSMIKKRKGKPRKKYMKQVVVRSWLLIYQREL
jgi:hypothetical protein